jgi:hypothetical protein
MRTAEFDIVFISYDEPNADLHYADLCNKVPWAKRVHGVKGSDHAHKAAAELSETEWFITVDGDNIVDTKFFALDLEMSDPRVQVYGWCGRNRINGLRYGNGGLKIWKKDFVLNMKTHEASTSDRAQVDFCWEDGYKNFPKVYSESIITGSPFQAWRAGFREGVKMTLLDGVRIPKEEIKQQIWWHNLHRLKIWSTVGAHEENGLYAIYGARMGQWMANCTDWNYIDVRDFEILRSIYNEKVKHSNIEHDIQDLGYRIKKDMGFDYPYLDAKQSKFTLDLYEETIDLGLTYYVMPTNV